MFSALKDATLTEVVSSLRNALHSNVGAKAQRSTTREGGTSCRPKSLAALEPAMAHATERTVRVGFNPSVC